MCGVCAEIGFENCVKDVLIGLKKLEYRGYDSSGIAFVSGLRAGCPNGGTAQ